MDDKIKVLTDAADRVRDVRNEFNLAIERAAKLGLKIETRVMKVQRMAYRDHDQIEVDIAVPVDGLL